MRTTTTPDPHVSQHASIDRRAFLATAAMLAGALGVAPAAAFKSARRSATRLQPVLAWAELARGVNVIADPRTGGNTMLVTRGVNALLVDTKYPHLGHPLRADALAVSGGTDDTLTVINTHHHGDHTGGNAAFQDARVCAHPNAAKRVRAQIETYRGQARASVRQAVEMRLDDASIAAAEAIATRADTLSPDEFAPRVLLENHASPGALGDELVQTHHFGPGHTDNDVVVHVPGRNLLHTGDLVFNGLHPFFDPSAGVTVYGWIASLWRTYDLCDAKTTVIPGHGPVGDRALIRDQITYHENLIAAVAADIDAGLTRDEAVAKTYPFMEGLGFAQIRPRAIGAVYDQLADDN